MLAAAPAPVAPLAESPLVEYRAVRILHQAALALFARFRQLVDDTGRSADPLPSWTWDLWLVTDMHTGRDYAGTANEARGWKIILRAFFPSFAATVDAMESPREAFRLFMHQVWRADVGDARPFVTMAARLAAFTHMPFWPAILADMHRGCGERLGFRFWTDAQVRGYRTASVIDAFCRGELQIRVKWTDTQTDDHPAIRQCCKVVALGIHDDTPLYGDGGARRPGFRVHFVWPILDAAAAATDPPMTETLQADVRMGWVSSRSGRACAHAFDGQGMNIRVIQEPRLVRNDNWDLVLPGWFIKASKHAAFTGAATDLALLGAANMPAPSLRHCVWQRLFGEGTPWFNLSRHAQRRIALDQGLLLHGSLSLKRARPDAETPALSIDATMALARAEEARELATDPELARMPNAQRFLEEGAAKRPRLWFFAH